MSARPYDPLRVMRAIASFVEQATGAPTHWADQNQPAPASGPYVALRVTRAPAFASDNPEERDVDVVDSLVARVPDPLPAAGEWLRFLIDGTELRYQIQPGDDRDAARDGLEAVVAGSAPVEFQLFSAAPGADATLTLTASELGGMHEVESFNLEELGRDTSPALLITGSGPFAVEVTCFGGGGTTATSFASIGRDSPASLWSTIASKLARRSAQEALLADGVALWAKPPPGDSVPAILAAGVEARTSGTLELATRLVDFEPAPIALTEIRATLTAKDASETTEQDLVVGPLP